MTWEQKVLIQVLEQVVLVFVYLIWCRSVYLWSSDIGGSYRRGDGSPWPHGTHLRKTTQSASATISHITWTGHGEHFSAYYNQNYLFLKHCSDILLFLSRNCLNSMSSRYVQWLLFVFHLFILWTHMGVYNTVCCFFFAAGVIYDRYRTAVLLLLRSAENERGCPSDRRETYGRLSERSSRGRGKPV